MKGRETEREGGKGKTKEQREKQQKDGRNMVQATRELQMGGKKGVGDGVSVKKRERRREGSTLCSVTDKRWRVTKAPVNTQ